MFVGGVCFSVSVFICSYAKSLALFAFFYSFVVGFGFGLIYMLPLRNAWLFYPNKKGMVSGIILSCYSIGAIIFNFLSSAIVNPNNESPTLIIPVGNAFEKLFDPDSDVVNNVPHMLRVLSYCFMGMSLLATLLITKKSTKTKKSK